MPVLGIDPAETAEFSLSFFDTLPEDKRPRFLARYITGREEMKVRQLAEEGEKLVAPKEALEKLGEALAVGIVGWSNFFDETGNEIPFSVAEIDGRKTITALDGVLSRRLKELVAFQYPQYLTRLEWKLGKAYASSPTSTTASSAVSAGAAANP
jgi:hypothetical protein